MQQWMKCGRGAALTALAWAVIWAPVAVLVGLLVDPDGSMDEMWVAIGAYPGFICGLLFSALLWIAERHRRIDEMALPRVAAWGVVAGLLVSLLPLAVAEPTGWGLAAMAADGRHHRFRHATECRLRDRSSGAVSVCGAKADVRARRGR